MNLDEKKVNSILSKMLLEITKCRDEVEKNRLLERYNTTAFALGVMLNHKDIMEKLS